MLKKLELWTTKGHDGHYPKPFEKQETFQGNQAQCIKAAKDWERKNPRVKVVRVWEK